MSDDRHKITTVGLLYPGELGSAMAALLASRGIRVVTTLGGRSERTLRRCRENAIEVLPSLRDVTARAQVVISLVPPAAAEQTAIDWCAAATPSPRRLYVDANSIGPELAGSMGSRIAATGHDFVDAAINGLAKNLATGGTLFVSGSRAGEVATLLGDAMRVQVVGDQPGRASAMKLLLSGLSKGLCALFTETALLADRQAMLPEMIEAYRRIYPGVMTVVERMLPTYVEHAARRATETRELEENSRAAGIEPLVLTAVRQLHEQLAQVMFDHVSADQRTVPAFVERLAQARVLSNEKRRNQERNHGQ